ncbi:hypothetical protein MSAN_02434500 [Mycena sanguinolenta]|uniref:Protein kinase domain-containing protein n=1 Tax=Mycena sanguinolenta TaxID=230812 RepID=A0A8H6WZ51_9AGAR|nr:hypothetical protein MSAN_02434500 [Mycena sanguinolenta]
MQPKKPLAVFSEVAGIVPIVGLDKIAKAVLLVCRAVALKLKGSIHGLNEPLEKILQHTKDIFLKSKIKQYLNRNDIRDSIIEYSAVLQDAVLLLGVEMQVHVMDWNFQNDEDRREDALVARELLEQIQHQLDDTNETITALPDLMRGMFVDDVFDEGALGEVRTPNGSGFAAAKLDVTVKYFPAATPAQVHHYLQTVKTWSRFRHLNVLRILWHSSLDAKPSPFIVVPNMASSTLDSYLNQEWGRYSHPDICTGIVSGLTYLRSRGLYILTLPASHVSLDGHRPIIHNLESRALNTTSSNVSKVFIADGILSANRLDSVASEHVLDASFAYTEGDRNLGRLSTHFKLADGEDALLSPDWKGLTSEYSEDVDSALCILRIVIKHITLKAQLDINLAHSMDELTTSPVIRQVIRCLSNPAHTTKASGLLTSARLSVQSSHFRAHALMQMGVISHLRALLSARQSFTWGQACWTLYRILDNWDKDYDPLEILEEDLTLLQSLLKRKENAWSRATSMTLLLSIWRRGVSAKETSIRDVIKKNMFPPLNKWLMGNDVLMAHNAFLGLEKLVELLLAGNIHLFGADPFASAIRWLSRGCDSGMLECILRCSTLLFAFPSLLAASSQLTLKDLHTTLVGISHYGNINSRIRVTVNQLLNTLSAYLVDAQLVVEEQLDSESEFER